MKSAAKKAQATRKPAAEKLDLCKQHKSEYATPRKPVLIEMGPAFYLAAEGRGEPGGADFNEAVQGLYGMAFTIKMTRKFAGQGDYKVCPLEGQWWGKGKDFLAEPKTQWRWKMMIRTPEFVTDDDAAAAREALNKKGKGEAAARVKLIRLDEGPCVQMLHVGPYANEPESLAAMRAFAVAENLKMQGRHHEIYLGDPRRTAPERLRTILRLPVKRGSRRKT